jgi:hypothetical protein
MRRISVALVRQGNIDFDVANSFSASLEPKFEYHILVKAQAIQLPSIS